MKTEYEFHWKIGRICILIMLIPVLFTLFSQSLQPVMAQGNGEQEATPTETLTSLPTDTPTTEPTATPLSTDTPTPEPTATPSPTDTPSPEPTTLPVEIPSTEQIEPIEEPPPSISAAHQPLYDKAQSSGAVRIIVGLQQAFRPEGELASPQDATAQQASIARAQNSLLAKVAAYNVTSVKRFQYIPFMAMEVDAAALAKLTSLPEISSIEEDTPVPLALADSIPLIGAHKAWAAGYSGAGWTVAILDSGVDSTHPFLSGKVVSEACFSTTSAGSNSTSVCPDNLETLFDFGAGVNCDVSISDCDHGTHVAGIAAGKGMNFSGVARDANIISIQIFSQFDDAAVCDPSPCIRSFTSDQMLGLERVYTLRNSFKIAAVNMSLGGEKFTSTAECDLKNQALKPAIDNLRSIGIATVISSGNDGFTDGLNRPACISTAISVGATTKLDTVADFSNSASFLTLLAPGVDICSSIPAPPGPDAEICSPSIPGSNFALKSGTSIAAPHVAGAWAVIKSKLPGATVDQILKILQQTGVPITDPRNGITKPRIQLDRAFGIKTGSLIGVIYNAKKGSWYRLPWATVTACTGQTTITNGRGVYVFNNLPVGYCRVTASKPGYQTRSRIGWVVANTLRWNSIGLWRAWAYSAAEDEDTLTTPDEAMPGGDTINILDLAFIASRYGASNGEADLNLDGVVNILDLTIMAAAYGQSEPVSDPQ